jgi:hypothetical protein
MDGRSDQNLPLRLVGPTVLHAPCADYPVLFADGPVCAHIGHSADPDRFSEADMRAGQARDGHGWIPDIPVSDGSGG